MNVLCEEQTYFRKGYSTMDHVLVSNSKQIYICIEVNIYFVHPLAIGKHLALVNRLALWNKLLQQNINLEKCMVVLSFVLGKLTNCQIIYITMLEFA